MIMTDVRNVSLMSRCQCMRMRYTQTQLHNHIMLCNTVRECHIVFLDSPPLQYRINHDDDVDGTLSYFLSDMVILPIG